MTSSAQLDGNAVADTPAEGSFMSWSVNTQEVGNNRSLIDWNVGWRFGTYSCRGLRQGQVIINGVTVYQDDAGGDHVHNFNSGHDHRPALVITSGQIWIGHNEYGIMNLTAFVRMTGFSGQYSEAYGGWDLPTIPRISSAPSTPSISAITQTSARIQFSDAGDGAPTDSRQISYSTSGSDPNAGTIISSDGDDTITGLTPNRTYFVWARTHNVAGYSAWSARPSFDTIAGARIKVSGVWKKAVPYVKVSGTWKLARPWTKVLGVWKENI